MRVDIRLRPDRMRYLEYIADRDGVSVSLALGSVVDFYAPSLPSRVTAPSSRERKHVCIASHHLTVIDRLATEWGVLRSDVISRLIDEGRRLVPARALDAA